jgi:hypothetical protein
MQILVYQHGGSLVARTNAIGQLQGILFVSRSLPGFNADLIFNAPQYHLGALEAAGNALADPNHILALRPC